ncbi:hypothetical protein GCM10028771_19920 [Nocardioides marmoraquaticus]
MTSPAPTPRRVGAGGAGRSGGGGDRVHELLRLVARTGDLLGSTLRQLLGQVGRQPLEQVVDRLVSDLLPAVHDDDVAVLAVRLPG